MKKITMQTSAWKSLSTKKQSSTKKNTTHRNRSRLRDAFTLVELLVVIAIIGILVGLLVPAIQNMREMSRRSMCEGNLVQLSLALSSYSTTFGHYPAGSINPEGPIKNEAIGYHHNWIAAILPNMDAQNVYEAIDRSVGVYDDKNAEVRGLAIPTLRCPSATGILGYSTCYAGMTSSTETPIDESNDGAFRLNLPVTDADITDGLSYTIMVGEKVSIPEEELGWISGTRSSLRTGAHVINSELARLRRPTKLKIDNLYVGGLSSDHFAGAYTLMGSGEYHFRSTSMDTRLMAQLVSRNDGAIPMDWKVGVEVTPAAKPSAPKSADAQSTDAQSTDAQSTDAQSTDAQPAKTSAKQPGKSADDEPSETTSPESNED